MKTEKIAVQNIKCHGCENRITIALGKIEDVFNITVDAEKECISFDFSTEKAKTNVLAKLLKMGYPLVGESNSIGSQTKSYISCMIGRVQ